MHVVYVTADLSGHSVPAARLVQALIHAGIRVSCVMLAAPGAPQNAIAAGVTTRLVSEVRGGARGLAQRVVLDHGPAHVEVLQQLLANSAAITGQIEAHLLELVPDFVIIDPFPRALPAIVAAVNCDLEYGFASVAVGPVVAKAYRGFCADTDAVVADYLRKHAIDISRESSAPISRWFNLVPTTHEFLGEQACTDEFTLTGFPYATTKSAPLALAAHSPRPLVYISPGTLFCWDGPIIDSMIEACAVLQVDVMLSLGEKAEQIQLAHPSVAIHKRVDQLATLARAAVFVTHGGYNSVSEAVRAAVPMLVLPIAVDQPFQASLVAARGLGLAVAPKMADRTSIQNALQQLLDERAVFAVRAKQLLAAAAICSRLVSAESAALSALSSRSVRTA